MNGVVNPSFAETIRVFARIGLLSFGGPAGQIALMHRMLVDERKWISEPQFLHALNFCMLLPGPEAQQLATYIGWLKHGIRGGVVAGVLFVVPGFCVIMALSTVYALFHETQALAGVFFGLKAAVLAVVVEALLRIGRRALKNWLMRAIAGLAFLAIFAFHAPFPLIVLAAGLIGYAGTRLRPGLFAAVPPAPAEAPAARGSWQRAAKVIAVCGALWIVPVALLGAVFGWDSIYIAIAAFFSKMAVVTFGGAYAVLSYVAQQAVENLGWLKPGEMLDGLALAETTPGPLILVLTYVGFLAGFRHPGLASPLAGGLIGASLTTWVTFVPCFLWIFLGAPHIERLRSNRGLSGALAAITAAVVGVILNLTIFLSLNTLFRSVGTLDIGPVSAAWPVWASLDPWALALTMLAMLAMFRMHLGMVPTLALCAALGWLLKAAL